MVGIRGSTHNTSAAEEEDEQVHKLVEDIGNRCDGDVGEGEHDDHDVEDELEGVSYAAAVKGGLWALHR